MTRALVTRARDDAERTAEKLRRLGVTPLISPVIEIVATGAAIPPESFDAALATSARAIVHAGEDLEKVASLPLYVVGARTAQAARRRGLHVTATASDAAGLIEILRDPLPASHPFRGRGSETRENEAAVRDKEGVSPRRFLYFAGRDRKDKLERSLRESGHSVSTVEVYEARAAHALSDEAIAAMSRGEIAAVLHFSARSAAIFIELARAGPSSMRGASAADAAPPSKIGDVRHLALSEDIARVLRDAGCENVRAAQAPDEESLLALIAEP